MSNDAINVPAGVHLSQEQLDAIAGGECTAEQLVTLTEELKSAYDNLVDFTSYVMERVIGGGTTPTP